LILSGIEKKKDFSMRTTLWLIFSFLVLSMISACSSFTKTPEVIEHPVPDLQVGTEWVEQAGCALDRYSPGHYSGTCSEDSPLAMMGCERITASDLLGGLPYPVVICENTELDSLGDDSVQVGCYLSYRTEALLTYRDGVYQFIGKDEIKTISVPIESPDEALSYVLASTNYYAMYDIEIDSFYHYFPSEIEETFVEETQNGFLLHLFVNLEPECGCEIHYTDAVEVSVDRDGNIRMVDSHHIYLFDGCVD
jgi:hypothetical protein